MNADDNRSDEMVTEDEYRRLALSLPGAAESAHMGHPDFRVGGRIFATLWPGRHGVVLLTSDEQAMLCAAEPAVFAPVPGGWGKRGSTQVMLAAADGATVESALTMAWKRVSAKGRPRR
ncbi:MAG TPA: MmcQ/YjbR family DNA-binding protein [Stellaceae bacterium]|nr:MmcQ/YjbR family DNA-binding protein [Stellaceae bacterium]